MIKLKWLTLNTLGPDHRIKRSMSVTEQSENQLWHDDSAAVDCACPRGPPPPRCSIPQHNTSEQSITRCTSSRCSVDLELGVFWRALHLHWERRGIEWHLISNQTRETKGVLDPLGPTTCIWRRRGERSAALHHVLSCALHVRPLNLGCNSHCDRVSVFCLSLMSLLLEKYQSWNYSWS